MQTCNHFSTGNAVAFIGTDKKASHLEENLNNCYRSGVKSSTIPSMPDPIKSVDIRSKSKRANVGKRWSETLMASGGSADGVGIRLLFWSFEFKSLVFV